MIEGNNIVSIVVKKPCPLCGEPLYYFSQLDGWSHIYNGLDIHDEFCHYNETTRNNVTETIESVVRHYGKEYGWHFDEDKSLPTNISEDERVRQGINSGLCDLFAESVKQQIPQAKIIYDADIDHTYVSIGEKFYDAENPRGVTFPDEMIFLGESAQSKEKA